MNKPLISVIIPVYNVEEYLPKCIDSVINQSYSNLEIILVDDGSTDNCPMLCDKFSNLDNRIKVIHKSNGGISSARNAALRVMQGSYVAFLDSDDWQSLGAFESLLNVALETGADIVTSGIYKEYPQSTESTSNENGGVVTISNKEALKMLPDSQNNIRFEVWNKIYKSSLFANVRFKEGQIYEDIYICRQIFKRAKKIAILNKSFYHYRLSRPGNTNSFYKLNKLSFFDELKDFIIDMKNLFPEDSSIAAAYERYLLERSIALYRELHKFSEENIPVVENKIKESFKDTFRQYVKDSKVQEKKYKVFNVSPILYMIYIKIFR